SSGPGPFGSSGSWEGWWEAGGDSPSPVAATAPASTGPWPVVDRDAAPIRPRPPVAAPPARVRPGPSTGPITWVDPPEPAGGSGHRDPLPSGRTLFNPDAELRRRVPQANLAPELRDAPQAPQHAPAAPVPPSHTRAAASALSRYQASREAARAAVGDGPGALANDRSALHDGPIATEQTAERYMASRPGETVPGRGTGRPRPSSGPDDVPLDVAGDEPSTAPEHTPPPGRTAEEPARPGTGPGAAATGAVSDGTVTGENRAMHSDATEPARDTREDGAPAAPEPTGGER
ncbi:hypothetical protein, partial [Pseudonocardia lacus]|uniref:hypothetical protein n=1 Tax=Pseudonocardia lacus TaxID=2835865 RepID=UPI001BDC73DB